MPRLNSENSKALGSLVKEHRLMRESLEGDMLLTLTLGTGATSTPATSAGTSRSFSAVAHLKNANGEYHTWADTAKNADLTSLISASLSTPNGTRATISASPATLQFSRGKLPITITNSGSYGTFATGAVITLTILPAKIVGHTFATKTLTYTFT